VLAAGEPGVTTDTHVLKVGDGATAWADLPEVGSLTYAGIAPAWVTGRAYVLHELVTSSGVLYECTTAHTSGGSFDAAKFTAISGGSSVVSSVVGRTGAVTGTQILADTTIAAALAGKETAGASAAEASARAAADALLAPLASPTLTGIPAVPTAAADTNTTQAASTAFVLAQASTATPTANGTAAAGTSTRWSRGDHVHSPKAVEPTIHGYKGWSYDPVNASGSATCGAGALYAARVSVPSPVSINSVVLFMQAAGVTLTSGQCFAGVWSAANGALIGLTANQSTAWESVGTKAMALTGGPFTVTGDVYVGWWSNGTTQPKPLMAASGGQVNMGLSAPNFRFCFFDTGLTTTAPSPLGTATVNVQSFWVAIA
jgi:hypothetical protein